MIQAYLEDLCVVGITRRNVEKLTNHEPMKIDLARPVRRILVVFGETKPEIIAELEAKGGAVFEASHKAAAEADPL